ncbi:MAG: alpha/beta fold hydrolase [Phycisphaerae bacterium]|nr:alpha/beta fold hydrolase [Phycisphaerae bacterium]
MGEFSRSKRSARDEPPAVAYKLMKASAPCPFCSEKTSGPVFETLWNRLTFWQVRQCLQCLRLPPRVQHMSLRHARYGITAALMLACTCCGCGILEEGRFPPPTLNTLAPIPSWLGLAYEDVRLETSQGKPVFGWFIPAEGSKATVLIHHGAITNRSLTFAHYSLLHELGYNVMVYDYQGYGENWNPPSLDTILSDANAALSYLQQRTGSGTDRIILFGISLGTLPAMAQAASSPDQVVGAILEGSFTTETLPPWSLLLAGIIPWANAIDHVPQELDPSQYIDHITIPKLFLQSREDLVTPFSGAERLCDLAPEPKQFVEVIGQHTLAVLHDPSYAEHLKTFLDGLATTNSEASDQPG